MESVALNSLYILVCLVGLFLNVCLVYVLAKSKSLHSRCALLIGLFSASIVPIQLGMVRQPAMAILGVRNMRLATCYLFSSVPILSGAMTAGLRACIGLDRMLCFLFPFWYKSSTHKHWVTTTMLLLCLARSMYLAVLYARAWKNANAEEQVACSPSDLDATIYNAMMQQGLALLAIELVCHSMIWLLIWMRKAQDLKRAKRLVRSLSTIMLTSLVCIMSGTLWRSLPHPQFSVEDRENFVEFPANMLMAISYANNAPIFCIFSSEYRKAFRSRFNELIGRAVAVSMATQNGQGNCTTKVAAATNCNRNNNNNNNSTSNKVVIVRPAAIKDDRLEQSKF